MACAVAGLRGKFAYHQEHEQRHKCVVKNCHSEPPPPPLGRVDHLTLVCPAAARVPRGARGPRRLATSQQRQ